MRKYEFVTVDVFTDRRFGGNPLAVFPDARGLGDAEMQKLAAEMNLSETTFVLPPQSSQNTARVRIFNRTAEMPFAGHPNVGTGFVLAQRDPRLGEKLSFEEIAGLVEVRPIRDPDGTVTGAEIDAPQPLRILSSMPDEGVASCIGLPPDSIVLRDHPPLRATTGVDFVIVEVEGPALSGAGPVLAAFQALADAQGLIGERLSILLYARDGGAVRSRMFAPLSGTWEDPATGSANTILGALLLSLSDSDEAVYDITQGTEMGRESRLRVSARRTPDGIRASVAGGCVQVLRGEASL
jgi:trans-2,3-dihydro-3-hydroxyanthranilate isomerase